jgi:MFS transporter, DHA1 family, multidrug resistance protein
MTRAGRSAFLIYATLLATIGLFASDMYLPALGPIQQFFRSDAQKVGLSLSLYMAGFAVAQWFYGALSDQIGRKPPLLFGLALFLVGTGGCLFADDIRAFLAFRVVQAVGVGAAHVLWQPMVFDLVDGSKVQRVFARLMAIGSLSPAFAPLAGGHLTHSLGWQSVFWVLLAIAAMLIAWTALGYQESLPAGARRSFSLPTILRQYQGFLTSGFFLGYAGAIACGIGAYFVFVTMLPLVLSGLGYAPNVIGSMNLPIVASFVVGAEVSRRWHRSLGDQRSCKVGAGCGLAGAILLLTATLVRDVTSPWQLIPPAMLITFGNGFLVPTGTAYLIKHHSDRAGACASAVGFLMALAAFASTLLASLLVDEWGVHAMTGTVLLFAAITNVSLYLGDSFGRAPKQAAAVPGSG